MTGYFFPVYYIRHLSQEKLTHFYKFYGDFFMKSFIPLNSIYITFLAELEDDSIKAEMIRRFLWKICNKIVMMTLRPPLLK